MHYQRAANEVELVQALRVPSSRILCGGTDLLVKLRAGLLQADLLLEISTIPALQGIREDNGDLVIGAATSQADLLDAASLQRFPILCRALAQLGSTQIRNRGTLGGNLVNASPAADSAVPLLVYEAQLDLVSEAGVRTVALSEFLIGPGQTALREGEYVRSIRIPRAPALNWTYYHKVGKRNALTIAIASLGMAGNLKDGAFQDLRIAAGSVAPTPRRLLDVEALIRGVPITELPLGRIHAATMDSISPISDVRATAEYRRKVVADLIVRALENAI